MWQEKQVIECLVQLTSAVEALSQKIDELGIRIDKLGIRMDKLESRMDKLESRIDMLETRMDKLEKRVDDLEESLNEKIDLTEKALDIEINHVYQISLENRDNIVQLLIPYNDRNLHVNDEVARIPQMDERLDEMETVVGEHSKSIREIQAALAG